MDTVIINSTPHIRSPRTTKQIMLDVVIALLPASIMGCIYFGWKALIVLLVSTLSAVLTEVVWKFCQKKDYKQILNEFDFTSVITGLLIGLCMPVKAFDAIYVPILASVFGIAIVKMLFGGTGKNIVNPAIVGRIFVVMSFTSIMSNFNATLTTGEVVSGATVLQNMLQTNTMSELKPWQMFLGIQMAGCIGETCKLALVLGGIYLIVRKVLDFRWPLIYIVVTGLIASALAKDISVFLPSILTGGLFIGAIFMATDYVTSPNNKFACYAYYTCLGILTAVLRYATKMEAVSFCILIMNLFVPIFNMIFKPRPFGSKPIKDVIKDFFAKFAKKKEVQ